MSGQDKKHPGSRADPETRARAIAALGILIGRHKTKSALAVALGVDRSSVRQWFSGRAFPSAKMATIILNEATIDQHKKRKRQNPKVSDLKLRKFYQLKFGYQTFKAEYLGSVHCKIAGEMAVFVGQDHNERPYLPILFHESEIMESVEAMP